MVSSLAGLRKVIIDAQKVLLDAAIAAGVPRFIPSDYSLDFTRFSDGENRNLDLRRESLAALSQLDFPGLAIGGLAVGEPEPERLKVLEEIEKERKEMEEMFTIKAGMAVKLREQEIKCKSIRSFPGTGKITTTTFSSVIVCRRL